MLALTSCTEFATPAELEASQILAIQSEPASVSLGSSATLSILVADKNGPVNDPQVTWSLQAQEGLPALGSLVDDGNTVTYSAPDMVPSLPTLVTVEARVQHADETLVALKGILIGGPSLVNPEIQAITVDGHDAAEFITLETGQESALGLQMMKELSEDATYAWYARPGTIDEYRSTPTVLVAPDAPGDGWLHVVVRDQGGIAYRSVPLKVE